MKWVELKRNYKKELHEFHLNLKAIKYLKLARKTLSKDMELSLAFRQVAEVYDKRSRENPPRSERG